MVPVNATGSRERATKTSQRRACELVGVDPKTVRRKRLADHADIRKQLHEIASKRRRSGYRRIGIMLEREGVTMNEKKLYRLYKEEALSVRRRRGRKTRIRHPNTPSHVCKQTVAEQWMPVPNRPNVRWSLDFMSDTFGATAGFRNLAVIDDGTRENLCLVADTGISGARGAAGVDGGNPDLRQARLHCQRDNGVAWHYIEPRQTAAERSDRKLQRQSARRIPG